MRPLRPMLGAAALLGAMLALALPVTAQQDEQQQDEESPQFAARTIAKRLSTAASYKKLFT